MVSISPSVRARVTARKGLSSRVLRCAISCMKPAMAGTATVACSFWSASSCSRVSVVMAVAPASFFRVSDGFWEMAMPRASVSILAFCSGVAGWVFGSWVSQSGVGVGPGPAVNSPICPESRAVAWSPILACMPDRFCRVWFRSARQSSAPALMSSSSCLTVIRGARWQKSARLW